LLILVLRGTALRSGNVDYYLRLEQGRDQHPSAQVLDALARALQLDFKATEHLHRLAGLRGCGRRVALDRLQRRRLMVWTN
jgi:hypothetical protein